MNTMTKSKARGMDIIELTAVESERADAQTLVCVVAEIVSVALTLGLLVAGFCLSMWVETITPITVWVSIGMVAAGVGFAAIARWINSHALADYGERA